MVERNYKIVKKFVHPDFSLAKGSFIKLEKETYHPGSKVQYSLLGAGKGFMLITKDLYEALVRYCTRIPRCDLEKENVPPKVQVQNHWEESFFKLVTDEIAIKLNLEESEQLLKDLTKAVEDYKRTDEKMMWHEWDFFTKNQG